MQARGRPLRSVDPVASSFSPGLSKMDMARRGGEPWEPVTAVVLWPSGASALGGAGGREPHVLGCGAATEDGSREVGDHRGELGGGGVQRGSAVARGVAGHGRPNLARERSGSGRRRPWLRREAQGGGGVVARIRSGGGEEGGGRGRRKKS